jgi:hypothetical protein
VVHLLLSRALVTELAFLWKSSSTLKRMLYARDFAPTHQVYVLNIHRQHWTLSCFALHGDGATLTVACLQMRSRAASSLADGLLWNGFMDCQ